MPVSKRYVWGATVLSSALTAVVVGSWLNVGRVDTNSGSSIQPEPMAAVTTTSSPSVAPSTTAPAVADVERDTPPQASAPAKIRSDRRAESATPTLANAPKPASSQQNPSEPVIASTWQPATSGNTNDATVVSRRVSSTTAQAQITNLSWRPRKAEPAPVSTWKDPDTNLIAALIEHQEQALRAGAAWSPSPVGWSSELAEPAGQSWDGSDEKAEWSAPANGASPNSSWSAPNSANPDGSWNTPSSANPDGSWSPPSSVNPNASWSAPTCKPDAWGNCLKGTTPSAGGSKN